LPSNQRWPGIACFVFHRSYPPAIKPGVHPLPFLLKSDLYLDVEGKPSRWHAGGYCRWPSALFIARFRPMPGKGKSRVAVGESDRWSNSV